MTTVLLAVDESEESIEAVKEARSLFGPDATYFAVNVADDSPHWAPVAMTWGGVYAYPYTAPYPTVEPPLADELDTAAVDSAKATAEGVASEAGVDAAPVGQVGDASTAILQAAETQGADVIVVAASEKGWWRRMLEGSVTKDLLERSPRPVLVAGHHTSA